VAGRSQIDNPQNGKEAVQAKVGPELYEKMFRHYTKKQWDKYPEHLISSQHSFIKDLTIFETKPEYFYTLQLVVFGNFHRNFG